MELLWKEVDLLGTKLPKWKRTFAVDQGSGQVFVAAALTGDAEYLVYICAVDDGNAVHLCKDRYYVPAAWMVSEFPHTKPICDLLQAAAAQAEVASGE